jgi:phage gpG-like protein
MLPLRFKIAGKEKLASNLKRPPLRDWRDFWPQVKTFLREVVAEQFSSQGGKGPGGQWPELSKEYAQRKAKQYPGRPVLQRTGTLYNSLAAAAGGDIAVDERGPLQFRWGTSLLYAHYHQTGTRRMPARRIFDFRTAETTAGIRRMALVFLARQFRGRAYPLAKEAGREAHAADLGAVL